MVNPYIILLISSIFCSALFTIYWVFYKLFTLLDKTNNVNFIYEFMEKQDSSGKSLYKFIKTRAKYKIAGAFISSLLILGIGAYTNNVMLGSCVAALMSTYTAIFNLPYIKHILYVLKLK